jgi:hypothetical protein
MGTLSHIMHRQVRGVDDPVQVDRQTRQVRLLRRRSALRLLNLIEAVPLDDTRVGEHKVDLAAGLEHILKDATERRVRCNVNFVVRGLGQHSDGFFGGGVVEVEEVQGPGVGFGEELGYFEAHA